MAALADQAFTPHQVYYLLTTYLRRTYEASCSPCKVQRVVVLDRPNPLGGVRAISTQHKAISNPR